MRTVSLMFSANCRTVVRLMEAWYDAQVSLRALAGRQFVYPSTRWGGGAARPPGPVPHPPPPHGPTLSGCTAVQPDIINNQGACTGYGHVVHQSDPPSSLHTFPFHTL
jgi:hypothetical protein